MHHLQLPQITIAARVCVRQSREGRTADFVYVEGIIMDINQGTKQYTVQLVNEELVSLIYKARESLSRLWMARSAYSL